MIDKRLPRKLNKALDSRLLPKSDMSDALNVSITEDSRGEGGNAGVLKPIKSNFELDMPNSISGNALVLGKCIDSKYDVVYFFLHFPDSTSKDGVYAYDPTGFLPDDHDQDDIIEIFTSSRFDFDESLFVKADMTYTQQRFLDADNDLDYEDTPMLFFTDNKNEPRKLNVLRAVTDDLSNTGTATVDDFITACPRTPVTPITAVWANDPALPKNEFLNIEGFQFAYQGVYKDTNETAISTYSDIYVPPGYLTYTGSSDNSLMNQNNTLELTVPVSTLSSEIDDVKILGRRGDRGSWFLLGTVANGSTDVTFSFNNSTVNSAVPRDVQTKDFDALPHRAEAQTIVDNRLMYGNYVENRDDETSVAGTITPIAQLRPEDFKTYEITAIPSVVPSPHENNKNIGFVIDTSDISDDTIQEGSRVQFSFTITPKDNFHIYNAHNSYHQSPQMGEDFSNAGYEGKGFGRRFSEGSNFLFGAGLETNEVTGRPAGMYWQTPGTAGSSFIAQNKKDYNRVPMVCSDGINKVWDLGGDEAINTRWRWWHTDPMTSLQSTFSEKADWGTSAANPLIVSGKPVTFNCSFVANQDLSKAQLSRAIALVLTGAGPNRGLVDEPAEVEVLTRDRVYPSGLQYSVDLGLGDGDFISDSSANGKLITTVGSVFSAEEVNNDFKFEPDDTGGGGALGRSSRAAQTDRPNPDQIKGFFVLNKAEVTFDAYLDEEFQTSRSVGSFTLGNYSPLTSPLKEADNENKQRIGVFIKTIELDPNAVDSILTCVRRPIPGSRWFCYHPWVIPGNLTDPAGFRNRSLFTSPTGAPQSGLQFQPEFSGAMSNSLDYFENNISDEYVRIQCPSDGGASSGFGSAMYSVREENIFGKFDLDTTEDIIGGAPWGKVFGGLEASSQYVTSYNNAQEPIVFFNGTKPNGDPVYSLMDGAGGPGGRGVHPDAHYDNYVLYLQGGYGQEGRRYGIQSLGSAPIFSTADRRNDNNEFIEDFWPGGYGPALGNNILIATEEDTGSISVTNRKRPSYVLPGGDVTSIFKGPNADNIVPQDSISWITSLPLIHGSTSFSTATATYVGGFLPPDDFTEGTGPGGSPDPIDAELPSDHLVAAIADQMYELKNTNPDYLSINLFVLPPGTEGGRTFKAGANHGFGVVFYDKRGRASNVHPIGSAYSPWFSDRVDGSEGPVFMKIVLSGTVPSYATHFQIVYSGNTSISRFVQYSTAGAFVPTGDAGETAGNIYVSLNYLQDHPASLSKAFGAKSVEGAQDVYTFRQGDRLRVVSHYSTETSRIFAPADYEFTVVDQVSLSQGTDNPLYDFEQDGDFPHPSKTGQFLVLENNPNATGFNLQNVLFGENDINAQSHNWGKRCVVEIYSPKKSQDEESLVYYETSNVYPIDKFGTEVTLSNGDTWFRQIAMNFSTISQPGDIFTTLINSQNSGPNFFPYQVESDRFSFRVANSDVNGKGKFKAYLPDNQRSVRSSSITYSDKNNPASKVFTLTSFNPTKAQFKDLPIEFGDINYIANTDDSIFVIQSRRCSSIPVNRNIITDLGDTQSLVAANAVLGTERFYAGSYGCDNNPESVCEVDTNIYFASKGNREVYRFNRTNGIQVISESGMKSFFRRLFEQAENDAIDGLGEVKVVGGYDPEKDSFILSVYNQDDVGLSATGLQAGPVQTPGLAEAPTSVTIDLADVINSIPAANLFDSNTDGEIGSADLLDFLTAFGQQAPPLGDATLPVGDVDFNFD